MQTKVCFKCQIEKSLDDFYAHKGMSDGRLGKCKSCTKADSRGNWQEKIKDPVWLEKEQTRHRQKYHLLGYREKHKPTPEMKKEAMKRYKEKYPEKNRCRNYVSGLRKKMGIPDGIELHHWNYSKGFEKDVIQLTTEEHFTLHRFLVYDEENFIYKTKEGVPLDTKEKHVEYFESIKMLNSKAA